MVDKKPRDPFGEHIESDAFDVSELSDAPLPDDINDIDAFLDGLPQPLTPELWDTALDDRQRIICAHLATELVERVLRDQHNEDLSDFSDEKLTHLLTVPIIVAMLAERELHAPDPPPPPKPHPLQVRPSQTTYHIEHAQTRTPVAVEQVKSRLVEVGRRIKETLQRWYHRFTS